MFVFSFSVTALSSYFENSMHSLHAMLFGSMLLTQPDHALIYLEGSRHVLHAQAHWMHIRVFHLVLLIIRFELSKECFFQIKLAKSDLVSYILFDYSKFSIEFNCKMSIDTITGSKKVEGK